MDSVKSMGNRTGSHTVDPASLRGAARRRSDAACGYGFHLGRTRLRSELARSRLLYGGWLRRERRIAEARDQLRIACQMLGAMGMEAFAERARRELLTTARQPVSAPPSPPARRPAGLEER
jgi:hypothetical protein